MALLAACGWEVGMLETPANVVMSAWWDLVPANLRDADAGHAPAMDGRFWVRIAGSKLNAGGEDGFAKGSDAFWYHIREQVISINNGQQWALFVPTTNGVEPFKRHYALAVRHNAGSGQPGTGKFAFYLMDVAAAGDRDYTFIAQTAADFDLAVQHWLAWRISTVSPFPLELWVDDVRVLTFAGDASVTNIGQDVRLDQNFIGGAGKGESLGITMEYDSGIQTDETGAVMNGRLPSTYRIIGHQPWADVVGLANWNLGGGTRPKRYARVDDVNDLADEANDYIWVPATDVTTWNMSALVDKAPAGSVEAVVFWREGGIYDTAGNRTGTLINKWRACADGDVIDGTASFGTGTISFGHAILRTTPGGADWTNAVFNTLQAGLRNDRSSAGEARVHHWVAEAVGPGLVRPAKSPAADNADEPSNCAPPPPPPAEQPHLWAAQVVG